MVIHRDHAPESVRSTRTPATDAVAIKASSPASQAGFLQMDFYAGKSLVWVPHHADAYENQKIVKVVEMVGPDCAKLDNGWIVDGYGDCIARTKTEANGAIEVTFTPPGYVDDCL